MKQQGIDHMIDLTIEKDVIHQSLAFGHGIPLELA